jgi:hypothetical protein
MHYKWNLDEILVDSSKFSTILLRFLSILLLIVTHFMLQLYTPMPILHSYEFLFTFI